jgi:hypothetical protein
MAHQATMTAEMTECIQNCQDCYAKCMETVQHCLTMGGKHASTDHISTLLACAAICQASATAMLVGSKHHHETCRACAAICKACEKECRAMGQGDDTMMECAEACAACARSCEEMAG